MVVKALIISNNEILKDKDFIRSCNFTLQEQEKKIKFTFFEYPCFEGIKGVYYFKAESDQLSREELINSIWGQVTDGTFENVTIDCNILAD